MAHRPATAYSALGVALGFGAPLGFFALRRLLSCRPVDGISTPPDERRTAGVGYWYMALATPVVFGIFGRVLGRQQEKLMLSHAEIQRLREEFAAVVAHDLRNPLHAILLHLEALLDGAEGDSVSVPVETLLQLRRGGQRLSHMVNDLLDATRIEAARLRVDPRPVSLPDAVAALLERIRRTLGAHPLEIRIEGEPPNVLVDPARFDQIATNLLENAAKYSADGTPIRVVVRPHADGAVLSVVDRGFGIPEDELPRLFDRFYQAQRARRMKSGLGLGLYITKGLVEAHGGRLGVESEVGRGSTFNVWLPCAPPALRVNP